LARTATSSVAYAYFQDEPRPTRRAAHLLAYDEARRIAVNIAQLSELLLARR
jgi:hypothetical protein